MLKFLKNLFIGYAMFGIIGLVVLGTVKSIVLVEDNPEILMAIMLVMTAFLMSIMAYGIGKYISEPCDHPEHCREMVPFNPALCKTVLCNKCNEWIE